VRADELARQGLENGALPDAAENAGFDLRLTCDQNVGYQQNFTSRKLALVVLSSNHLADSATSCGSNRQRRRLRAKWSDRQC
jgi:hypothetical protein